MKEKNSNDHSIILENIAQKHLHIKTLKTRNSDSLDFYDIAVWCLRNALEAAYNAGKKSNNMN